MYVIKVCMHALTVRVGLYAAVLNHRTANILSRPQFERTLSYELIRCTTGRYRNIHKKKNKFCIKYNMCSNSNYFKTYYIFLKLSTVGRRDHFPTEGVQNRQKFFCKRAYIFLPNSAFFIQYPSFPRSSGIIDTFFCNFLIIVSLVYRHFFFNITKLLQKHLSETPERF